MNIGKKIKNIVEDVKKNPKVQEIAEKISEEAGRIADQLKDVENSENLNQEIEHIIEVIGNIQEDL